MTGASRKLFIVALCAALVGLIAGCGSSGGSNAPINSHSNDTSTAGHVLTGLAAWDAKTQQICREKAAAIAGLGSVHITYGGIARLGLPAVKKLLEHYLDRLLSVLRHFAARQQQLATPPSRVSIMARARALDGELQAATVQLQSAVAGAPTPAAFSSAFRAWLATLQRLATRGEALAQQLKLPACESARTTARSVSS